MPKNDMNALRDHLFDVIERLKASNDPDCDHKDKIDIETAKQITDVAKVLVESAKAEVSLMNIASKGMLSFDPKPSGFLLSQKNETKNE